MEKVYMSVTIDGQEYKSKSYGDGFGSGQKYLTNHMTNVYKGIEPLELETETETIYFGKALSDRAIIKIIKTNI